MVASGADAALLIGNTVTFSFDESALDGLFGSYSIQGDTLLFTPSQFVANVNGGGPVAIQTANATTPLISVSANAGYQLSGLRLNEQGDYFRIESSPLSSFVGAAGQFIVNNQASEFVTNLPLTNVTTFASLAAGAQFATTPWTVSEDVALQVASATVLVQNVLVAGALSGSSAFIEKKLIAIGAWTTPVPLPAAIWGFGTVLLGFVSMNARRLRSA